MDITTAIVDYTSAFIAYEESYRCVLFAQADTFRRKSLLRNAFSRWSMESAMIQQDKILQQQYLDDLHDLIDTEYMVGHQHRVRSETGGNLDAFANTIDSQLGLLPARGRGLSTGFGQSPKYAEVRENDTMPAGFWDSDQMGREGFESLCKALRRYGVPAFQLSVALFHTQPESVLHSWLWWQIDPSSISQTSEDNESSRWVVYSNNGQTMTFREYGMDSDDQPLSAQIVLLSPEPLEARHLGGAVLGYSRLEDMISNCVESALELARTRANNNDNGRHASMPLLFIFWYTDSRVKRSVRRMVESIAGASGIPSFVSINVLALDIANSKKQLAAGMRWMYKHLYQSLRSSFVRVPRAYAVVCDTMVQSLRRMRNCIIGLLKCWPSDTPEAFSVFNDVVSVANAFIEIFNTNVFVSPKCPRVCKYPHLTDSQTLSTAYFGQRMHSSSGGSSSSGGGVDGLAMLATNLVVGAAVDEILCSDTVYGSDGTMLPTLGAYMRAFEVVVKNQLDMLQQSLPADIYADKQAVAAATKQAVQMSGQLVEHAARLCQQSNAGGGVYQDPFMTPRPKRSLSLAFSNGSPPLSLFSAAFDAEDTPESTAQSVVSMSTQSTTVKRQRASPSFNLSRLQGAIARASRHLK
ncbi:hypothetical protein LPJ81_001493 [Coemansia sp. IMI 209127]|nr:hypothetical protein LPJ81_001493 [Coemansia sp. IMI 209127]